MSNKNLKKQNIKFSIIVTSYNNDKFITQTLNSILEQTYKNYEVIIVDDGSKDDSLNVIKQFTEKYENVHLYTHENNVNKGLIETTKLALKYSTGDYIAFCECDDYWTNNFLEEKYNYIINNKSNDIIVNNIQTIGSNVKDDYVRKVMDNLKQIQSKNWFSLVETYNLAIPTFSIVTIKSKILKSLDFNSPISTWLDWWLWRQCANKYSLNFIDKKLTYWRIHNDSFNQVSEKDNKVKMKNFIEKSNNLINPFYQIKTAIQFIFSIKNTDDNRHKKIYILGIKIKIKRKVKLKAILQSIFSIHNSIDKKHKIVTILGLEIKIKRKLNTKKIEKTIKKEIEAHYKNINSPKILIVSHEFSLTGAPKVALLLAQTINKIYNHSPITITLKDGPIKHDFITSRLKVIDINENYLNKENFKKIAKSFDLIIIHSWCYKLFGDYDQEEIPPIIWWSHEAFGESLYKPSYPIIKQTALSMKECWTGSPLSQKGLQKICPEKDIQLLLYGVEDIKLPQYTKSDTIEFIIPGTLEQRKGQEVLLKAIKELPENILKKANFTFIGGFFSEEEFKRIQKLANSTPSVNLISHTIPFVELMKYYAKADCIIVPSRFDPMPMVATYAFMFKKLCIISDAIGTACLTEHGKDCIKFKNGDYIELAMVLKNVISNIENYESIANNGFEVYQKHFSMKKFETTIKEKLSNILSNK